MTILGMTGLAAALGWGVDRLLPEPHAASTLLAVETAGGEPGFVLEPEVVAAPRFLERITAALPDETAEPATADWVDTLRAAVARTLPDRMAPSLEAEVRDGGGTLRLAATAPTSAGAEALAAAASAALLEARLERRGTALDERLGAIAAAIGDAEAALALARERLALAEPADRNAAARNVERAEAELAEARAALADQERALQRLRVALVEPLDLAWLRGRPRTGALLDAVAARDRAAARLTEVDRVYGDRHPLHMAARAELETRDEGVRAAVELLLAAKTLERDAAAAEVERGEMTLARTRAVLAQREAAVSERAGRERAVAAETARLAELEAQRRTLETDRLALLPDARLVAASDAVPVDRRFERAGLIGGAAGGGLLLGLLLARLRAGYRPARFKTSARLAEATGVPVLAALPRLPRRMDRLARSRAAERVERLWLQSDAAPVPTRSLAVIGADRTVDAARLAAALAWSGRAQGYSVLLIDGGAPALPLHRLCRTKAGPGLAEVLAGEAAWTDQVVALGERGPWLLRRGAESRGEAAPSALDALLQSAERRFDRVILAAPPLGTARGLRFVRSARAAIVAVRAGVSRRRVLEKGLGDARAIGVDVVGLVLTDASRRA